MYVCVRSLFFRYDPPLIGSWCLAPFSSPLPQHSRSRICWLVVVIFLFTIFFFEFGTCSFVAVGTNRQTSIISLSLCWWFNCRRLPYWNAIMRESWRPVTRWKRPTGSFESDCDNRNPFDYSSPRRHIILNGAWSIRIHCPISTPNVLSKMN